jgi:hypothetical protein
MSHLCLKTCLSAGALLFAGSSAQASEVFYRDGYKCQRASSGYIVCRDPRDRWGPGFVAGRGRGSGRPFYRDGYKCQRASSGHIVCRDPRDRWGPGFVVR